MKKTDNRAAFSQSALLYKIICLLGLGLLISQHSFSQEQKVVYRISFAKNQFKLYKKNRTQLQLLADSLQSKSNYKIHIIGHTDSDADTSYNKQLSLKRSMSVKNLFIENGIEDNSITVSALGEEQPMVKNTTPFGKAENRRVEIVVLYSLKAAELEAKPDPVIAIFKVKKDCIEEDTLIELNNGYKAELSKCDWMKNKECLKVRKYLRYNNITVKENWFRKHIGFKNYKKVVFREPYYEFAISACTDSCFDKPVKLFVPQYQAVDLDIKRRYNQKNKLGGNTFLSFKKTKRADSAYYTAEVYCPGTLRCGNDNRCDHLVKLKAKNNISILEYSYYIRGFSSYFDSLVTAKPQRPDLLIDNYRHAFFHTLVIVYKGDTITLKNIPIDLLDHGIKRIKTSTQIEKSYFLFIPFTKFYKCGHYKKYKLKARNIEALKALDFQESE